jgi:hypothetical protein
MVWRLTPVQVWTWAKGFCAREPALLARVTICALRTRAHARNGVLPRTPPMARYFWVHHCGSFVCVATLNHMSASLSSCVDAGIVEAGRCRVATFEWGVGSLPTPGLREEQGGGGGGVNTCDSEGAGGSTSCGSFRGDPRLAASQSSNPLVSPSPPSFDAVVGADLAFPSNSDAYAALVTAYRTVLHTGQGQERSHQFFLQ